ncbi:hypothetical protein [Streptomyces sparsogenes]|uniref:hypothetical protein n=1 Tax=Streptomyces sparsogenes TaxID=67365 RepID=UPI003408B682
MDKPAEMFDRDFEWAELTRFAALPTPRATLGVVSGRRRQVQRIRALLTARGTATNATRLQCHSGGGFTDELRRHADNDPAIELIDLDRLYHGA